MDKLYQLDVSGIFLLISLAAVKKFGVATENCHLDSTSLSVEGEYKKEYPTVEILKSGAVGEEIETRQVKIAGIEGDQIVAIKEQVLPALASTVVTAKYKGKTEPNVHFIASIFAPKNPMLSGMPAVVTVDKNNNCKIVIDNCAPYDVIIDRNDILALMDHPQIDPTVQQNKTRNSVNLKKSQSAVDLCPHIEPYQVPKSRIMLGYI